MMAEREVFCYDRRSGQMVRESVLGCGMIRFVYSPPIHPFAGALLGHALVSRLMGWYADRPGSRGRIAKTIRSTGIDMAQVAVPEGGFPTFNAFFTRRLVAGARPFPDRPEILGSPTDCRLTVYPRLEEGTCVPVKGRRFTVAALLGKEGEGELPAFRGGSLCVCRLAAIDYHRYHYPDDGTERARWRVGRRYESVHPFALSRNLPIFTENVRTVSILETAHFGKVAFVEVGAFGVGSITQTHAESAFRRGEEKGYFSFGGSTIILVFGPDAIRFDADLLEQSAKGVESLVHAGEAIGRMVMPDHQCQPISGDMPSSPL